MIAAPDGAPTSENVSVCAGRSESVALAVNVYGTSSGVVAVAGTPESAGCVLLPGHGTENCCTPAELYFRRFPPAFT